MTMINPQFCPKYLIMLQGPFWKFTKFLGSSGNFCQIGGPNWFKIHNSTGILPIIHILFCSESRKMFHGPICNFAKVWGLNCNFCKLMDQTEILSFSTSNPEFQQKTYCSFQISNSKFTIQTKS